MLSALAPAVSRRAVESSSPPWAHRVRTVPSTVSSVHRYLRRQVVPECSQAGQWSPPAEVQRAFHASPGHISSSRTTGTPYADTNTIPSACLNPGGEVGRPSGRRAARRQLASALTAELYRELRTGRCAYCRWPARPSAPLTREHVIARAKGGGRKDVRIIVAACARCNHRRGCRDFVPFLLDRPRRISSFLDYLSSLSPESIREIDPRVYAELYVAVAIITECADLGPEWKREARRLCRGRLLHRRRYAARRAVHAAAGRLETIRRGERSTGGPSCVLPGRRSEPSALRLDEPLEQLGARLVSLLSLRWRVPGEVAERELKRALTGSALEPGSILDAVAEAARRDVHTDVLSFDQWKKRPRRKRLRVDRRGGMRMARGRAA
ncbi:MAG: hypothetical protein GEU90_16035 [Gemmatimonas sp.]|nr:hypothetical protein [Gemmatimonas sp.]